MDTKFNSICIDVDCNPHCCVGLSCVKSSLAETFTMCIRALQVYDP